MFSQATIEEIESVARKEGIDAAALLAVCEVESGGRAFALIDGKKEPLIRFEGHYFDRLVTPEKRIEARRVGLASPKAGGVKNPRGQAARWALLEKAKRLDSAAAVQSVSWGIGQVMGSHWKVLGYPSPFALVNEARSSISGQVRLMVRYIRTNRLTRYLALRDWAGFARRYNGPNFRKNSYDSRMAAAFARHSNRRLKHGPVPKISKKTGISMRQHGNPKAVRDLQLLLTAAGFPTKADGSFGKETDRVLRAFQKFSDLRVDGIYGQLTKAALEKAVAPTRLPIGWLFRLLSKLFAFRG